MEAPHWILRVVACLSDESWWDGLILGFAVAALPFVFYLWWTQ